MGRLKSFFATSLLVALLLINSLAVTGCTKSPPSRFEQAQQESTEGSQRNQTVSKEAEAGGSFNRFFPEASDDFDLVYTQEKDGFAQAKLKREGQEMAVLSIFDTISNPDATQKFQDSSQTIGGYPAVQQGSKGTAVLVGDRFQVKALSRDPSFAESDRETWLAQFDLDGLAQLK